MDNATTLTIFTTAATTILDNSNPQLSWYDYVFLTLMLGISGGLGIYFGCCGQKEVTAKEFLMGGRNMKVVPVAISLIAR